MGGQEFDAVVLVGLEQGVVPPQVVDNPALAQALEQQALREMYLSISRAKEQVIFVVNKDATPNTVVTSAVFQGLIRENV